MKLASLKEGGRDGTLVVVNRDMSKAVKVPDIAPTMQAALDNWAQTEPALIEAFNRLQEGNAEGAFDFDPKQVAAPLPRSYHWADGSAYVTHVEMVRKARGRGTARFLLDRPAHVHGRLRCVSRSLR